MKRLQLVLLNKKFTQWVNKNYSKKNYKRCHIANMFQRKTEVSMFHNGRDSVVSILTHYRLDGPGIKSW